MRLRRLLDSSSIARSFIRLRVAWSRTLFLRFAVDARELLRRDDEPLHRAPADDVPVDDLVHVLDAHAAVPRGLGIHDDGDAARALVETQRLVRAHDALQTAVVKLLLERG